MNSLDVIDDKPQRAALVHRTNVLDKVGTLATATPDDLATTAQVAAFYEVDSVTTIAPILNRHRAELQSNGYRVLKGTDLRKLRMTCRTQAIPARGSAVALWDRKAVLNLGMLLRDSPVAQAVRSYLLTTEVTSRAVAPANSGLDQALVMSIISATAETVAKFVVTALADVGAFVAGSSKAVESSPKGRPEIVPAEVAEVLGVQMKRPGLTFVTGVSGRDFRPWAGWKNSKGKVVDWIPRADVITAYKLLREAAA